MKRTVKFTDAKGNRATVEIEIQQERNGFLEFSASGEYCGGCGQCLDHIEPKNEEQTEFLKLCAQYHLNGMNAGTPAQTEAIKAYEAKTGKRLDYDGAVKFLKSIRKHTVKHPKTGQPYQYGSGWIVEELPANIEEQVNHLADEIEARENVQKIRDRALSDAYEKHPSIVFDLFLKSFNSEDEAKIALALNDGLTVREALEITVDGNNVTCQGVDYLAGNDDVMNTAWDDDLENYIDDCLLCEIKDETLKNYFDRDAWKKDAKGDGRGHSLNRYDGGEDCQTVEGEEIYIYKQ